MGARGKGQVNPVIVDKIKKIVNSLITDLNRLNFISTSSKITHFRIT